ncbi:MAG: hypothetical protein ACI8W3_001543 [Myxococcota bacterium]|jgi:hypothetical protein
MPRLKFPASMLPLALLLASLLAAALPASADETKRNITTIVAGGTLADGRSQIKSELIEECVVSLPKESDLEPIVNARSKFMKSINGDDKANGSVRTYSAVVTVAYVVRQKQLVIVTTSSVEKSEPVIEEVAGRFDRAIKFTSNPENGDHYAGRELVHEYYFSNEDLAVADAMKRARVWLKQQRSVMCDG